MSSGLPSIYVDHAAPACTYEGDNIVMMLQTARYTVSYVGAVVINYELDIWGSVLRKVDSAIHRVAIFSNFPKLFIYCTD